MGNNFYLIPSKRTYVLLSSFLSNLLIVWLSSDLIIFAFSFANSFEEDILEHYKKEVTLEKLFAQNKDRFIQGMNLEKDGKRQKTWYDIQGMEEIEREDSFFDYFFCCKLRHLSLLDLDDFLNFHLDYSFKNNKQDFFRFLNITLRQYQEKLLNQNITDTVKEWIKINEADTTAKELSGAEKEDKEEKIKGRIQREHGDHLTSLSQNQTALLIQFMQKAGILLKGDNLTFTQAGKAFNILTGYSTHTLRQQLGTKGEIEGVKHEDYKELYEVVMQLAKFIEEKVRK